MLWAGCNVGTCESSGKCFIHLVLILRKSDLGLDIGERYRSGVNCWLLDDNQTPATQGLSISN